MESLIKVCKNQNWKGKKWPSSHRNMSKSTISVLKKWKQLLFSKKYEPDPTRNFSSGSSPKKLGSAVTHCKNTACWKWPGSPAWWPGCRPARSHRTRSPSPPSRRAGRCRWHPPPGWWRGPRTASASPRWPCPGQTRSACTCTDTHILYRYRIYQNIRYLVPNLQLWYKNKKKYLSELLSKKQCCGFRSIFRSFLDPDPYSEYGSGFTYVYIGLNGGNRCKL